MPRLEINNSSRSIRRCCGYRLGYNVNPPTVLVEKHTTVCKRKQCPVAPDTNICPRNKFRTALPHEYAACRNELTRKRLYTQAFADAVTAVSYTTLTFLVCHKTKTLSPGFSRLSRPVCGRPCDGSLRAVAF